MNENKTEPDKGNPEEPISASLSRQLLQSEVSYFGKHTRLIGVLLIILGAVGVIVPPIMSVITAGVVAGLLTAGGLLWAMLTFRAETKGLMDWLKPLLLLATGIIMVVYPQLGIASLTILLTFYLVMDSASSFTYAQKWRPKKGWGWMLTNSLVDLLLAGLFIYGWPKSSILLLGIYVGISLIFDGWALVAIGSDLKEDKGDKV